MRRVTAASLLSAVLVAGALLAASVSLAAESGPKCADITHISWNYPTGGTINVGLVLNNAATAEASAPCKSVTYTLIISGITGGPLVVPQKGNHLFTGVTFGDTDNNICISATTSSSGGKTHDAAPDVGCLEVTVGTSGGRVGVG
jgi:hypothetical protein